MRTSTLSIIKDILILFLSLLAALTSIKVVIPRLKEAHEDILTKQFILNERTIVKNEVDSVVDQIVLSQRELSRYGVSDDEIKQYVLKTIAGHRYGPHGYGYFFVLDENNVLLLHPVESGLMGRSVSDIRTLDGKSLALLFSEALRDTGAGYLEYVWKLPGKTEPEKKTTYAVVEPRWGWTIASGFYVSELKETIEDTNSITSQVLSNAQRRLGTLFVFWGLCVVLISAYIFHKTRRTERDLETQMSTLEKYKLILDETSLVSRTDVKGIITYVNDTFCRTTGYKYDEAIGRSHNIERHPDTPLETFKNLWETISAGGVWTGLLKNRKADGSSYFKQATIVPIQDASGRIVEYVSSGQDVTDLIEHRKALERTFYTDQLTGLGNRFKLLGDLENLDVQGVALINIIGFGETNRVFGQEAGDEVLKQLSLSLLDKLDAAAFSVYRLHADFFAVLGRGGEGRDFDQEIRRLHTELNHLRITAGDVVIPLVARTGIAMKGKDSYVYADIALERAKTSLNGIYTCDEDLRECSPRTQANIVMMGHIQRALDEDRVYPVFQPILRIETGRVEKYECLMRMETEDGRVLFPNEFLEISKKTRSYQSLTLRIIEKAVEKFRGQPYMFSVNLSVDDLISPDTISFLMTEAWQAGVLNRMIVEVIETEELEDSVRVNRVFEDLVSKGIQIAVDDFGSGYSSFNYLLRLNPSYVKIDGSIVQGIGRDERARQMVASVVSFARQSGMRTVAEYVDSSELLETLRTLGVDFAQGYLIGKPERELLPLDLDPRPV